MAANNYFGFAHTGTQYSTPAATYQTGQAGYNVPNSGASYSQPARAAQPSYEGYQSAGAYGFAGRQQDAAPPPPPASTTQSYDASYYQRPSATTYDGTKTYYQQQPQAKTSYPASNAYSTANRANNAQKNSANNPNYGYAQGAVSTTYPTSYNANNAATPATTAASYSGYDAALYSAATMYVQQQQQQQQATSANNSKAANNWNTFKKPGGMKMNKPKQPPKPQQLHYCDVCKISCAGPQTYREHLEGQKHKKKEAAAKTGIAVVPTARPGNSLRCELCDVTCTGGDAYAAHIRGAKHQKVVKLHTKLGKPIPSTEPTVVGVNSSASTNSSGASASNNQSAAAPAAAKKTVVATPKITFVGGTKLSTTATSNPPTEGFKSEPKVEELSEEALMELSKLDDKSDIQPVGQDYIEEIKNEEGKVVSFQCKLCECRFNDPNAKEMHMKGRRHRLQYKKKVNPELVVDIKPSLRQRKIQEEKMRRQQMKDDFFRRRDEERWREEMRMMAEEERLYWEEARRYEEEMEYYEWYRRFGRDPRGIMPPPQMMRGPFLGPGGPSGPPMPPRRPDTLEDRHVLAKHSLIYPKEDELQAVQRIVSNTEKALKQVSDFLVDTTTTVGKTEDGAAKEEEKKDSKDDESGPARILKGVMRVGVLAKGLLLRGDKEVNLVVLCAEKPTKALLMKVGKNLPEQLSLVCTEKYETRCNFDEASIYISTITEPKITVTITLTSPIVREPTAEEGESVTMKDPPDVLDRPKCLDALAALRHAKWFQARASGLQSCVLIIRILRDLCQRVPTWTPLNNWALELLVEKVLCSAGIPLSAGDALRRVLEAMASGVLLPGGPGLLDPCEKDPTDASANMTNQEREDITASAQHALRLLSFRQIHKVLGMDPLPVPKFIKGRFNRKRRRDTSSGDGPDGEVADGKKDKKDEGEQKMEGTTTT